MVKSARDRIDRAQVKFDPYVNQLRAKAALYRNVNLYARRSKMEEELDLYMSQFDFGYGKQAIARKLAFDMYGGKEVSLETWLSMGLPESAYWELKARITAILTVYEFCLFPMCLVSSRIKVSGLSFEQMYDDADGIVNKIAVDPTLHIKIESESCLAYIKQCVHSAHSEKRPYIFASNTLSPQNSDRIFDFNGKNLVPENNDRPYIFSSENHNPYNNNLTIAISVSVT